MTSMSVGGGGDRDGCCGGFATRCDCGGEEAAAAVDDDDNNDNNATDCVPSTAVTAAGVGGRVFIPKPATMLPPTGTIKFLSVDWMKASTRPFREADAKAALDKAL